MMTVFETGRIDYMVRTGFFRLARQQKWYFPTSSISVQFLRPLKSFQKAVLTTRLFHMTEYFIFIEQKISRQGKDIAMCMGKCKVKSKRESIATEQIVKLLHGNRLPVESKEIVDLFEMRDNAFRNKLSQKQID